MAAKHTQKNHDHDTLVGDKVKLLNGLFPAHGGAKGRKDRVDHHLRKIHKVIDHYLLLRNILSAISANKLVAQSAITMATMVLTAVCTTDRPTPLAPPVVE